MLIDLTCSFTISAKKSTKNRLRQNTVRVSLSKTQKMDQPIESDIISEMTEEEIETTINQHPMSRFIRFDMQYLFPLFTRRFSRRELSECRLQMSTLANQWYQVVRSSPTLSEEENNNS